MEIRAAEPDDLETLTNIYNHYVESSHVTFDLTRFTVAERRDWFHHHAPAGRYRLLVAVDGAPVGYVSSGRWRPKPAYDATVELSVYVAPGATGRGYGRRLCQRLLEELAGEDVTRIVGGVALPNPASVALLSTLGFQSVGTFTQVGRKFGRFWDVQWFERAVPGETRGLAMTRPEGLATMRSA